MQVHSMHFKARAGNALGDATLQANLQKFGSAGLAAVRPSSTKNTTRWRLAGSSRHSTSRSAGLSGSNTPSVKTTGNSYGTEKRCQCVAVRACA